MPLYIVTVIINGLETVMWYMMDSLYEIMRL